MNERFPQHCQLAARCMIESGDHDDAIDFLDGIIPDADAVAKLQRSGAPHEEDTKTKDPYDRSSRESNAATLCVLKARVLELLENRVKAAAWYKRALECDFYCYEAFEALVEKEMINETEERQLLSSLKIKSQNDPWLYQWYCARMLKYDDRLGDANRRFGGLERDWNLADNEDLVAAKAKHFYCRRDTRAAYKLTRKLKERDPDFYNTQIVSALTLFDMKKKSDLFYLAHQLADSHPKRPESWFAVGCYYLLIGKFAMAQTYFERTTSVDPHFAPGWIAYGNAFAAQDESDQAMAAYRTASRLYPGCHVPLLYIAMEYVRTNNKNMASQCLRQARQVCTSDPLVFNEMGVIRYKEGKYESAGQAFRHAIDLCKSKTVLESILVNLGHACRKLRQYERAVKCYERACAISPRNASTIVALGFAHHLQGHIDVAIETYHAALGINPTHSFACVMLSRALRSSMSVSSIESIPSRSIPEDDSFLTSRTAEEETDRSGLAESSFEDTSMIMDDDDDDDDDDFGGY